LSALAGILRGWGCRVLDAADRAGAQAHMAETAAALWLFDYHLDDGDTGVGLAADLSGVHGARPTLILSADTGHAVRRAVMEAGHSLLAKPLNPLALKSVLDRLLAASELRHAFPVSTAHPAMTSGAE
jgi:DNA-binding response OmpR family regulator